MIFPNFDNCTCCEKDVKDDKHNSIQLVLKNASSKLTVFLELCSLKTVCFSEQIMATDKYLGTFSHVMEAIICLFIPCSTNMVRILCNCFEE